MLCTYPAKPIFLLNETAPHIGAGVKHSLQRKGRLRARLLVRSEFLMEVYREIESLPPVRKKVFKLFYIDGLDSQEIARLLRMTPAAVYNNKLKALKQLRCVLFEKKLLSLLIWLLCATELFVKRMMF